MSGFPSSVMFLSGWEPSGLRPCSISSWPSSFWICLRLINHWLPFFPSFIDRATYQQQNASTAFAITGGILLLLVAGHVNALTPRTVTLHLTIPKRIQGPATLNVVAASDIHLGTIIGKKRLDSMVAKINALNPDIVLLPGDIVDEDLAPVIKHNLGEHVEEPQSRWGVFAITGNHEYIGGVEEASAYLSDHGVTVLRDRVVKLNDSFYLVGREDRSIRRTGKNRKPLQELLAADRSEVPDHPHGSPAFSVGGRGDERRGSPDLRSYPPRTVVAHQSYHTEGLRIQLGLQEKKQHPCLRLVWLRHVGTSRASGKQARDRELKDQLLEMRAPDHDSRRTPQLTRHHFRKISPTPLCQRGAIPPFGKGRSGGIL